MSSFKSLAVAALLCATAYSAPTIRQRLGQVRENKLAQVEAQVQQADCGCGCDVDYPVIPDDELPGAGNDLLGDGIVSANYNADVNYVLATEFVPTTTTQTKTAAESCVHHSNKGKSGSVGVRCRHFDINGGICVNEWVDSAEFECGWDKTEGCSAKAQTSVSGLADTDNVDLSGSQPCALNVAVSQCTCHCDDDEDDGSTDA